MHLIENMSPALKNAMDIINDNLTKTSKTREKYWQKNIEDDFEDFLMENDIYDDSLTIEILREEYFKEEDIIDNQDFHESYRFQEYNCF